jgi:GNAT superfamily N-acetyltransferase
MLNVRRATENDIEPMVANLCRAFADDPVMQHVFRGPKKQQNGMRAYFRTQMRADYMRWGGCYTTDDHMGSSIWGPAGKPLLSGLAGLATLRPVIPYVYKHMLATVQLTNLIESLHPKVPHWYLATLGTDPDAQGKGVGSALLQPVLDHCDQEGIGAYLESSKEKNIPFYSRHGFEVQKEVDLPAGGPKIWTMWREPNFSVT